MIAQLSKRCPGEGLPVPDLLPYRLAADVLRSGAKRTVADRLVVF